jgi:hypothetical protein
LSWRNKLGLGDVKKATKYIWYVCELARNDNVKKLLQRAYDAVNEDRPWD